MKAAITVFCKVGRADAQPLATFDNSDTAKAARQCDAVEARKAAELDKAGVSADRVQFTREVSRGK